MTAASPFQQRCDNHSILVDKFVGSSYDVVKLVAMNIDMIAYVGANMRQIQTLAGDVKRRTTVTGTAGALNVEVIIPLPTGATIAKLSDYSVVLVTAADTVYTEGSGYFRAYVGPDGLHVTVLPTAPANLVGSQIRWTLTTEDPLNV
ncbi:hypothetical protein PP740_gp055 [Stenotrophomonas phage Philippe]|uniref:Uncharacterized protein n=1 Tax=Stenotrophomonas phage Philippe TaxID=2859655 RepID=A0AAE7WMN5_9CAUD|nr:hypothetical protein PP740_gp055 [Stenotrophomonas phage Philippe]QYW02287.1 hypothetical protein CPT_Philippe_094 [Stenotrophomonas phage Philippe]